MQDPKPRLLGVELFCGDLDKAKCFYRDTVGLPFVEDRAGRYAKLDAGGLSSVLSERARSPTRHAKR
jgi:catechol 2,3-dioxygenase-like lactoylglutathione lyase family enzyme